MAVPATREALRLGGNLNFGAGGMSIEFLVGTFVKSVVEDELTGEVTISYQDLDGMPQTAMLDGSLLINAPPDADPQPTADASTFGKRRVWWDGVTLKYVARAPGHGLQVTWPSYASASYRGEFRNNPPNFEDNQFYYHLGAHSFVYRINGRNVGGSPSGWRGHRANQAEAEDLVTANGQLFEWNDNVHISANYVGPVDDLYFWKSLFGDIAHDSDKADTDLGNVDDDLTDNEQSGFRTKVNAAENTARPSSAQIATGTDVVRRQWAVADVVEAISEHERFTDVDRDILEDIARVSFPHPTDDWSLRQTYYPDQFFANRPEVFLSLGWDADNRLRALSGTGHVGRLGEHDQGRIYDGATRLRGGLISGTNWLFLTDSGTGSRVSRATVNGGVDAQLLLLGDQYFNIFADPDSGTLIGLLRRLSATQLSIAFLSYDAVAGSLTAEDSITVERTALDTALGAEFENLPDVHTESLVGLERDVVGALLEGDTLYLLLTSLEKADGHFVSVLLGYTIAGNPGARTLTPLAENARLELPLADDLRSGILPEEADELFVARDTAAYRLSPRQEETVAEDTQWSDVQGRPNRPTAQEIIDGTSVDEAVSSVSDVVAIANAHSQRALSNADPENVGNEAAEGTEGAVSRRDHAHRFPYNNTLQYDEDAENFGINIHDATEHVGHTIRYFTNEDTFTNGGGLSEGQIYTTSRFRKLITKVQLQTSNLLNAHFRVRIKTVDADRNITGDLGRSYAVNPGSTNPHSYPFYDADENVGIVEEGNQRIAILLEGNEAGDTPALRYGAQEDDSPGESYPDASDDFHLENDVVYADRDPAIGQHTHSHGNDIRGNIKIFYQLIYGHDDLGSEIEPSDAIPQPNTEDGSAGDDDNYSRANHSHPGSDAAAADDEVLFDNYPTTDPVEVGTLFGTISASVGVVRLAANPTETVETTGFLIIDNEIMAVTAVSGFTIDVDRAQFSTVGAQHLNGAAVFYAPADYAGRHLLGQQWDYSATLHQNRYTFGRALIDADEDKDWIINWEFSVGGARWFQEKKVSTAQFRALASLARAGIGNADDLLSQTIPVFTARFNADNDGLATGDTAIWYLARRRWDAADEAAGYGTLGDDGLVLAVGTSVANTNARRVYTRIALRPRGSSVAAGQQDVTADTTEVLFDNRAAGETALSVLAGSVDWARTIDIGFTRALVEADDDQDLRIRYQITQGGQISHFDEKVAADTFRLMPEYTASSGNILPASGHLVLTGVDGRASRTATSLFARVSIGVRQRTAAGEDALRILMGSSGNSHVAATNIRGIVELVPRVGGAASSQQQSSGGTLARRTVVAGNILASANNFDFDVTGGGAIATNYYVPEPIPLADIFDFVATVRVGGRAGFPLQMSREQFFYVGDAEEIVGGNWPYSGSGGVTWGNVSEIPCAMLSVNHRSEGVSKTQLRPQRQQIGWTIDTQGTVATAILFFFDHNDTLQTLTGVRMVVFTDQVVEIEGIHFHYWEN